MALIKCEECGQMVSDKASACPHCGCPVEKPMICPECGQTIDEGDLYCQKCGSPLNQNTQPQVEDHYSWEDDEEKPNNTLRWLLVALAALVLLGGAALYAWQSGIFNRNVVLEDTVAVDSTPTMAAPVIELDGDGMFSIDDCPTTYEGLEVVKHKKESILSSIDIMRDGLLLRTFKFNDDPDNWGSDDYPTSDQVHFLDANFDGFVDIFLGPGDDREYSALFIWDPNQSNFVRVRVDNDLRLNGYYQFHPSSQKVYYSGSGGASFHHAVRLSWQENELRSEESLDCQMSRSFIDEEQPARYVVRKGRTGKIIFSNDDPNQIPSQWKKWARIPTAEEEREYNYEDADDPEGPDDEYSNDEITQARGEMIEIETQIQREKNKFMSYYEEYRSLMQQYGTTSPNPYLYDNLMGVINRIIELSDKGEKAALKAGNNEMAENYRKDARMCRNAKNQLIMQH